MTSSSANYEERVIAAIARAARKPVESITPSSTFEELGIESLEAIEILFELEEEFDINIEDDESIRELETIGQVLAAVKTYVDAGPDAAED